MSIVRNNLMTVEGYKPYCGNPNPRMSNDGCHNPRTRFNRDINQFECPVCHFTTQFEPEFIDQYKARWSQEAIDSAYTP